MSDGEKEDDSKVAKFTAMPTFKKRKRTGGAAVKRDIEADDDGEEGGEGGSIRMDKDIKKPSVSVAFSTKRQKTDDSADIAGASVASSRSAEAHTYGGGAFAHIQYETEHDRDAAAIRAKNLELNDKGLAGDGIYRGAAGQTNFIKKSAEQLSANKFTGTQGPIRAQTFARSSVRFDYQPDICKDYKQTGFCGFGDSCKFMHDRGDYKAGWQIEKEYQEQEKKKLERIKAGLNPIDEEDDDDDKYVIHSDDDDLPFACIICRNPFTKPIVTKCGHYFCEVCAIKRYGKSTKCAACKTETGGVFNVASKILEKMKSGSSSEK